MGPIGKGERPLGHCDIQMRPLPACLPRNQGQQDIHHRRIGSASDIGDQPERGSWLVIRSATERQDTRITDVVEIVAGGAGLWSGLAIAGDRTIDETGIDLSQRFITKPQPVHHAGTKLLYQNIGLLDQRAQTFHCAP